MRSALIGESFLRIITERRGVIDKETPERMLRAYKELCSGYKIDPKKLIKVFDSSNDQMIVVRNISLVSLCEHHVLPFVGKATVGYLPHGKVIGLSKIPRIVEAFSRRLQIQERLTEDIAYFLQDNLNPLGVGVVITATHFCSCYRGARAVGTEMVTSCLTGAIRDHARDEFFRLSGLR